MKKILSILFGTIVLSTFSFAQNCTVDNSITSIGIYPDVSQGFKDGYVNTYYEQVAQVNILSDTVIDLGAGPIAATISYVVIDSVVGMPSGFSYKCNTVDCKIMGGGNGCTLMYGTPILADVNKTFNLTIYTTLYGLPNNLLGLGFSDMKFPVEFTDYSVKILPEASSLNEVTPRVTSSIYPNPAVNNITIKMNSYSSEEVYINISNTFGSVIKSENVSLNSGLNTLDIETSNFNTGLYIITIEGSFGIAVHKLMIK